MEFTPIICYNITNRRRKVARLGRSTLDRNFFLSMSMKRVFGLVENFQESGGKYRVGGENRDRR